MLPFTVEDMVSPAFLGTASERSVKIPAPAPAANMLVLRNINNQPYTTRAFQC